MMHKIMAEASRSIIGMLSAKPAPMETHTAYNQFNALMNPGDDRPSATLDNGSADLAQDKHGDQSLDQFVDYELASAPPVIDTAMVKTGVAGISLDRGTGDKGLSSDAASETERFISHLLPKSERPVAEQPREPTKELATQERNAANDSSLRANATSTEQYQPGMSVDHSAPAKDPVTQGQGPLSPQLPVVDSPTNGSTTELGDVAKLASIPLIFVDGPGANSPSVAATKSEQEPSLLQKPISPNFNQTPSENKTALESKSATVFKPVLESAYLDDLSPGSTKRVPAETIPVAETELSDPTAQANNFLKAPIPPKPVLNAEIDQRLATNSDDADAPSLAGQPQSAKLQNTSAERDLQDVLKLRSANQSKAEAAPSRRVSENQDSEPSVLTDKPVKMESKPVFADIENRSGAVTLNSEVEMVAPVQSTVATAAQTPTQKTVSFDWNAPQFAERFASEIRDLTISGDLKKFEINPRNMGRLEVSLITRGQTEIIQIEAESNAVRDVIAQNSQAIQDMLKGQGRSDLQLRVDVRENSAFTSPNDNMNFGQQDNPATQEERPRQSQKQNSVTASATETGSQIDSDNGRYA